MFKQISIILISIILLILLFYHLNLQSHKIYTHPDKIKYIFHGNDRNFLYKYSKQSELKNNCIFYITKPWNKLDYVKFKETYYIIEPGYYYYTNPEAEFFLSNTIVNLI